MRSMNNTHFLVINKDDFNTFADKYPHFSKVMKMYEKNVLFRNVSNALDLRFTGKCITQSG